jgi:ribonuclease Z
MLAGVVVVAGIAWLVFRDAIVMALVGRVAARNMQTDLLRELPDGLHVGLCGAGSPLPDPERSGPCVFVVAGERLFVVDAGSGSSRVLARMRVPQGAIEAILLTHLHSDHIDGLGELEMQRWANGGHDTPVPVLGPEGVEDVVAGIDLAYRASRGYRVAHHGADVVPPGGAGAVARPFESPRDGESVTLIDDGGLLVRAFRVDHAPVDPAVGYRFDYAGRSVAISGDTKKSTNVVRFAHGVDLLVHEALSTRLVGVLTDAAERAGRPRLEKITRDIVDYHTTPVEAAEVAQAAGARHLLLDHIVPPLPLGAMEPVFLEGVHDAYEGPVTLGRDGTFVRMDAGGDRIEVSELL